MSVLEAIIAKAQRLSPERQREALDFIEFLAQKEPNGDAPEPSEWRWDALTAQEDAQFYRRIKEQKEEIRRLWLETD